ncbi:uncharacterized protein J4E79_002575 [Alternaria viburni]|uniref:uncharacterized protein n=1 Tax=Alternaria viburni TaxID=566460 RepID=UPI0020C441D4|nr:uncharacterized protein J4E79_002575 [Alternaria viburni]KAI4666536.1 hypothetical protein J4E79_002575 [Alternaria viburni]
MSTTDQNSTVPVPAEPALDHHFKYTVQKGVFMQSEDETDDKRFDFKTQKFGLIDRSYPGEDGSEEKQWKRLEKYVASLEATKKDGESYKVLFLGRHGQGWHNVAETKYGTKAWDCYYAALDGFDGITWADANLTTVGQDQALAVNKLWAEQLPLGIPPPQTYYVSPLTRTIETANLSFKSLPLPSSHPYKPFIKELVREALGVHTCDRRSTASHIKATFTDPPLTFEPGFSNEDLLWEAGYREPRSARRYRLATFLDDVFATDDNVWLSFTSHSGAIGSILEVLGHRTFALETGGVIPVFVKAERVQGKREVPPKEPSASPPLCDGPPHLLSYPRLINYHLPIPQQQKMSTTPPIKRDLSWTFDQLKTKYDILWNAYCDHYIPLDDRSEEDKKRIAELETLVQEFEKKDEARLEERKKSEAQSKASNEWHDIYVDPNNP